MRIHRIKLDNHSTLKLNKTKMVNIKCYFSFILAFCLGYLSAQQAIVTTGGDAESSTGSISYSIGQVLYHTQNSANYSEGQGVQQPFEISVLSAINFLDNSLKLSLFPNPTSDFLILQIDEIPKDLVMQLFDSNGTLLDDLKINSNQTDIPTSHLLPGIYFLKMTGNDKLIQTYKVIKH